MYFPQSEAWRGDRANRQLLAFGAFMCAFFVYCSSLFRFWDVFAVKRQLQVLVFASVVMVFGPFIVQRLLRCLTHPAVLLPLAYAVSALAMNRDATTIGDVVAGGFLAAVVVSRGLPFVRIAVRVLVVIAGIFALMAMLQFAAVVLNPDLAPLARLEGAFDAARGVFVRHPFALLGQATDEQYVILGFRLTRLFSFASEPSAMSAYFMVPGGLALTLPGPWKLWAVPSIFICAVSLSGTMAATFVVTAVAIVWLWLFRKRPYLAAAFPLILTVAMITVGSDRFSAALTFVESYAPFPSKFRSGTERFALLQEHWEATLRIAQYPLGMRTFNPVVWTSLPLMAALAFGIPGMVLQVWMLVKIFWRLTRAYYSALPRSTRLGIAVLFGTLTQACAGTAYGFVSATGIFLQALVLYHVSALIEQANGKTHAAAPTHV